MAVISDLPTLIATMTPVMAAETFVFCSLNDPDWAQVGKLAPVVTVLEEEGLTVVVSESTAISNGLACGSPMRKITLTVYSDLEAVGLTAAFAEALTSAGVSANVVAGYHHDHIFVPRHDADKAMSALIALQKAAAVGVAG